MTYNCYIQLSVLYCYKQMHIYLKACGMDSVNTVLTVFRHCLFLFFSTGFLIFVLQNFVT